MKKYTLHFLLVIPLLLIGFVLFQQKTDTAYGSAPSGLPARIATSSTISVGPQETFAWFSSSNAVTDTNCAARIISTTGQAIAINFSGTSSSTATSTLSLTVASGMVQAASTTVAYDSGIYGCGYLGLYGYGATTTVRIAESR